MRKTKTFTATRGYLTATGPTKTIAKANLETMVDWACRTASPVIESRFGLVLIVAASPTGYITTVFDPSELHHADRKDCFTYHSQGDYSSALESVRSHAAQWAWNAECRDDATHVTLAGLTEDKARDLASWIRFQRNYIALKAQGKTNAEAFSLANGLPIAA